MAAQPTGPPARRCRAFAGANQSHPDLDFRGKSLQTESAGRCLSAIGGSRPRPPRHGISLRAAIRLTTALRIAGDMRKNPRIVTTLDSTVKKLVCRTSVPHSFSCIRVAR
jgi:hypothetical protein